jgi:hypothetical protein
LLTTSLASLLRAKKSAVGAKLKFAVRRGVRPSIRIAGVTCVMKSLLTSVESGNALSV